MADHEQEMEKIERRLNSLETRLAMLESEMVNGENKDNGRPEVQVTLTETHSLSDTLSEDDTGLETLIGRFGLAWLGNIVLLFGIIFLTQYLMNTGNLFLSILVGYISAASIFFLAGHLKKLNEHLSFIFKINAQIILFYVTLRLHFFSASQALSNKSISVIILLLLVALQVYIAIRDKSQAFATLSLIFALTTAVVSDTTFVMLPLVVATAYGSIYYYYRFNWNSLLVLVIILTYSSLLLWLLGNPVMGHPSQLIADNHSGVIFLFGIGAGFSFTLLLRKEDGSSDDFLIGMTFVNGILFTLLLVFIVLGFFSKNYVTLFSIITVCCLSWSIVLHLRSGWNFASAFYALYGFMAMSIALYGLFGMPQVYLLLSVQSLVVVSMALWFRNRLIVVMNSLLFLAILLVYILSSKYITGVSFSFALVPLISARIINWKRSRLQIKTDLIRNLYMAEGFFMVLFALVLAVPKHFITLSWAIAALVYFIISLILKNIKYRYMALGTLICAAFYLFIFGLARIELIYRVLALLFLAVISIGISMYYTSRIKKSDN